MFMAEKLIITEEVKKQNNMAFKMRSGNKVSFKNMGSSPAKQRTIKNPTGDNMSLGSEDTTNDNIHIPIDPNSTPGAKPKEPKYNLKELEKAIEARKKRKKTSPAKQKLEKGQGKLIKGNKAEPAQNWPGETEGQDENKIFNSKGEHVGNYVNDKVVMKPGFKRPVVKKDTPVKPKEGDMEKYSDLEKYDDDRPVSPNKQAKTKGLGPRTAFGGVKNPELTKTKKPFSTKVMKDGPEKQVTGIDLGKDPHWQPHPDTFKTKKKK